MTKLEARKFASEFLSNTPTVSEYFDGELGTDWVYAQSWMGQLTASWGAASYLAEKFGTEWKRTASGAAARLP